jgi:tetratricopeptide (TPR) repeat protein
MSNETPGQPKLAELLTQYLNQQAGAHACGLSTFDPSGEVVPFEAGPVQPVDPKPAWDEAVAVLPFLGQAVDRKGLTTPPHWPNLVASHEPVVAVAFCAGNFPQLMRNLHLVLQNGDLSRLRPSGGRPIVVPALLDWAEQVAAKKQVPQMLLAAGSLRLANQFDDAADYLLTNEKDVPEAARAAWANEKAALAWHRGQAEEARSQWQAQPASVPVLFNRGMAALFLGHAAEARKALSDAVAQLPEDGAWHHLGRLYLALAQARA